MSIKAALFFALIIASSGAIGSKSLLERISSISPTELRSSVPACPLVLAGNQCPLANGFGYYSCCGPLYAECCFYFQDWINLIIVILASIIIFGALLRILQAIFGTR